MIDAQTVHEWEIRLNSNVMCLQDYLRNNPDIVIFEGDDSNQKLTLSEIVEDIEDVRQEIEEEDLKF
jgi:hypothetical protein